jgi:hypothetical protein
MGLVLPVRSSAVLLAVRWRSHVWWLRAVRPS